MEGFRKKFYDARRGQDETAAEFVVRLIRYLDRWIQLTENKCSYESLKALLVRERFLDSDLKSGTPGRFTVDGGGRQRHQE